MRIRSQRPRRGSLLICVFACMVVVGSLVALMVQDALSARREIKTRLQLQQTDRLLDAGILRATVRLGQDQNYQGETWQPKLTIAGREMPAAVTIAIDGEQTTVTARLGTTPNITTQSYVYSTSKVQ